MNRIAIIVLNWNGAKIISQCLDSLLNQSYGDYLIYLVDNNSTDDSKKIIEKYKSEHQEKIELIFNQINYGFAAGVNIGIRAALTKGFDAVALFNNDACADKFWLENLVKVLEENREVGVATGLLLKEDGKTIDSTGDWYSSWGLAFPRFRDHPVGMAPESGMVFGATGGASLYRMTLFREVGLFDERFFAYYEDVDFSFRAQLQGWKVFYSKTAVAYHKQGESSRRIPGFTKYQMFKNLPMLLIKNVPNSLLFSIWLKFTLIYWLMFVNTTIKGDFFPALKGILSAVYFLPSSMVERGRVQKAKKVTDGYIKSILWPDLPPNQKGILRKLVGQRYKSKR